MRIEIHKDTTDINAHRNNIKEFNEMLNIYNTFDIQMDSKRYLGDNKYNLDITIQTDNILLKDELLSYIFTGWEAKVDGDTYIPSIETETSTPNIILNATYSVEPHISVLNDVNLTVEVKPQITENKLIVSVIERNNEVKEVVIDLDYVKGGKKDIKYTRYTGDLRSHIMRLLNTSPVEYESTTYVPVYFKERYEECGGVLLKSKTKIAGKTRYYLFCVFGNGISEMSVDI